MQDRERDDEQAEPECNADLNFVSQRHVERNDQHCRDEGGQHVRDHVECCDNLPSKMLKGGLSAVSEDVEFAMVGAGLTHLFRAFHTAVDEQYSTAFTSSADADCRADSPSCTENKSADAETPPYTDPNLDRPQDAHDEGETRAFRKAKTQNGQCLRGKECLNMVR